MNRQEIYDKVAGHLLAQGKQSLMPLAPRADGSPHFGCAYRGEGGMSCAAGCLIADEHYSPRFENETVSMERVQRALIDSGIDMNDGPTYRLVDALQICHDNEEPKYWPFALFRIAERNGLTPHPGTRAVQ